MSKQTSDKRALAASLIRQALDLGVRKELRSALEHALDLAEQGTPKELTQLHYDRLKPSARLADPNRRGLIVKATSTGIKRWLYRTTDPITGKQVEHTLGYYPAMGVAQARQAWSEARARRAAGELTKAASGDANKAQMTMAELTGQYVRHASGKLRSWRQIDRLLSRHLLPECGAVVLGDLTQAQLDKTVLKAHRAAPQQARKLKSAISGVLKFGKKEELLPAGFAPHAAELPEVDTPATRTWVPQTRDLRAFLTATRDMGQDGEALRLIALTGVRLGEALEMRWDEVEGDRWTIPAERMKAKRPHTVLLSEPVSALLDARRGNGSDFVFPALTDAHAPRSRHALGHAWQDRRKELGLSDQFTIHTLRKALATWVAENGGGVDLRNRLTAHTVAKGIDAHDNQAELNKPAAEWWAKWADHLIAIEAENVVTLGEARA